MRIKVEALGLFVLLSFAFAEPVEFNKRFSRRLLYHLPMGSHSHLLLLHVADCFVEEGRFFVVHTFDYALQNMSVCLDFLFCYCYPIEI